MTGKMHTLCGEQCGRFPDPIAIERLEDVRATKKQIQLIANDLRPGWDAVTLTASDPNYNGQHYGPSDVKTTGLGPCMVLLEGVFEDTAFSSRGTDAKGPGTLELHYLQLRTKRCPVSQLMRMVSVAPADNSRVQHIFYVTVVSEANQHLDRLVHQIATQALVWGSGGGSSPDLSNSGGSRYDASSPKSNGLGRHLLHSKTRMEQDDHPASALRAPKRTQQTSDEESEDDLLDNEEAVDGSGILPSVYSDSADESEKTAQALMGGDSLTEDEAASDNDNAADEDPGAGGDLPSIDTEANAGDDNARVASTVTHPIDAASSTSTQSADKTEDNVNSDDYDDNDDEPLAFQTTLVLVVMGGSGLNSKWKDNMREILALGRVGLKMLVTSPPFSRSIGLRMGFDFVDRMVRNNSIAANAEQTAIFSLDASLSIPPSFSLGIERAVQCGVSGYAPVYAQKGKWRDWAHGMIGMCLNDYNMLREAGGGWREKWWYRWGGEDVDMVHQLQTRLIVHRPRVEDFKHVGEAADATRSPEYYKRKNVWPDVLPVVATTRAVLDVELRTVLANFVRQSTGRPAAVFEQLIWCTPQKPEDHMHVFTLWSKETSRQGIVLRRMWTVQMSTPEQAEYAQPEFRRSDPALAAQMRLLDTYDSAF